MKKMTPDTRDTLIHGHPPKEGEKLLEKVDEAEAQDLYRYLLVGKSFCYFIKNALINGSISHGVGIKEINGFIAGIEALEGPVKKFTI